MPVEAVLRRDPGNPFDSNAIAVHVGSALVGHITREVAAQISPTVDRVGCSEWSVCGIIRGGTASSPSLGVHLWLSRRLSAGPEISHRDRTFAALWWPPDEKRLKTAVRTLAERD